jgi:GTP-binding protein YchF
MKTAIIGLPMVGKTSLFTILTGFHESARVGMMEARQGVTQVPDPRVEALAEVFEPKKVTHATLDYLDFPSISMEALRNPGYLSSMRLAEALAHVIRVFDSDTVPHEKGSIDPMRDLEEVQTELILSDLMVVEKRLEKVAKDRRKIKDPNLDREHDLLVVCKAALEENHPLRTLELSEEDDKRIRGFQFLSRKPVLFVFNLGEDSAGRLHEVEREFEAKVGARPGTAVTAICGKVEAELAEMEPEDAREFMESYGLAESGLDRLIAAGYKLLGLMSILTVGEAECRAWTVPIGCTALKAAGAIHTDFEKKFIRAEVANWRTLVEEGGYSGARQKGLLRLEGKEYVVQDGDVLVIRHGS